MSHVREHSGGFTLIELAIVVLVIGILAAIVIPNYLKFASRAKDALVRENMHVIQTGMETYAVDHLGTYPQQANEVALLDLLPDNAYPRNPFDNVETSVAWNADPAAAGDISIFNLPGGGYTLKGQGANGLLSPSITVGD